MSPRFVLRSGAVAAFAAVFLLGWQFVIGVGLGNDIALLSKSVDPARMALFFQTHGSALTQLMAADNGFATAYAVAFVALAYALLSRARLFATLALVFALATACIDLAENSLLLASVETVAQNQTLNGTALIVLFWLGQVKFLAIYVGALLFAIGVWETGLTGKIFAVVLVLFPLIGLASIAIEALVLVKVAWMFVMLAVGGVFLLRAAGQPTVTGSTE